MQSLSELAGLVVSGSGSLGDTDVIGGVELVRGGELPPSGGGGRKSVDDTSGLRVDSGKTHAG